MEGLSGGFDGGDNQRSGYFGDKRGREVGCDLHPF
jgi:hypothetical protein